MSRQLSDLDLSDFWLTDQYYADEYTDDPLTPDKVAQVERQLGFKLPASYVALMEDRNGGAPTKSYHRTTTSTSWSAGSIAVTGIFSIGSAKRCSLLGEFGSRFWNESWAYPDIGVYFADCPSAGHDMLCLDYRECGPSGEPKVVHVDQESDYKVTLVAPTFEEFICGLESDEIPE